MLLLRANTAVDVLIGPFIDDTDGKTAETALTLSQGDIKLSKNGQALAQKNDDTAAAADANGYYNCELDAIDTNTEGQLVLIVHESGALPVRHEFLVLSEAAWDSLFVAKDDGFMDVNIKTVGRADTQETEANNLESACANYSATRGLSGTALPAAAADAAGGLPISDAGGLDLDAQIGTKINSILEDTGTTLQNELDGIQADTEDLQTQIGTDGAGLTNIPWNPSWDAEVQSECADALIAIHLDHLLAADYDPASKPGTATALLNELVENDGGVSRFTENALEQAPSGTGASAASIADAVWDEAQADHVGAGTFGIIASEIADILVDTSTTIPGTITTIDNEIAVIDGIVDNILVDTANIGAAGAGLTAVPWNAAWDAEVQSECTDALNAYDPPTKAELDVVDGHISDTFDDVGDVKAVVDNIIADTNELQTDWHDGGRLDLILDTAAAGGGGGGDATAANQTTIINHLTDLKGATFDSSTDSNEAIRNRGDSAWVTGGGLTGSNSVTLTIQAPSGTNIVGAFVDVFDSGNTTFIGRLITNSSGQVSFSADDGTYTIRILKAGYTFTNQTLVVNGTETETYTGTAYAPAAPSAASICRVYEYAYDPDGTPMSNVKAYAKINTLPYNANSVLYAGQNITAEYNSTTGLLYWDLVQGSSVKFVIKDLGVDTTETIPASSTVRLSDI